MLLSKALLHASNHRHSTAHCQHMLLVACWRIQLCALLCHCAWMKQAVAQHVYFTLLRYHEEFTLVRPCCTMKENQSCLIADAVLHMVFLVLHVFWHRKDCQHHCTTRCCSSLVQIKAHLTIIWLCLQTFCMGKALQQCLPHKWSRSNFMQTPSSASLRGGCLWGMKRYATCVYLHLVSSMP